MKRLILAVLFGLALSIPSITAQTSGFSQTGKPGLELLGGGNFIAHSSLPLNSKAKVVNTVTGKELEVTVVRHIPASPNRIADISTSVWQKLELNSNTDIRIYTNATGRPVAKKPRATTPAPTPTPPPAAPAPEKSQPPAPAAPEVVNNNFNNGYYAGYVDGYDDGFIDNSRAAKATVQTAKPAPVVETRKPQAQTDTVSEIWAKVARPPTPAKPQAQTAQPASETRTQAPAPVVDTRAQVQTQVQTIVIDERGQQQQQQQTTKPVVVIDGLPQAVQPAVVIGSSPQAAQPAPAAEPRAHQDAPVTKEVLIIPGLPDANSDKTYLLQVGAYSSPDTAARIARQLEGSGYSVAYEPVNSMHRILIKDVPAALVYDTAQQLRAFGIEQVWVRE